MLERAAAAMMLDAMTELLPAVTAPTQTAAPVRTNFEARVGGPAGALCGLTVTPSHLIWHLQRCDAEFQSIPLNQINTGEIDDGNEERAVLLIKLVSGRAPVLLWTLVQLVQQWSRPPSLSSNGRGVRGAFCVILIHFPGCSRLLFL